MKLKVGLDVDGVLYPWHSSLERYFRIHKGFTGTSQELWKLFRSFSKEKQAYYVSIPLLYSDSSPIAGVQEFLPKLAELAEVYYITARSPELERVTVAYFDKYSFPFKENLIFSKDKATPIRLHRVEYFLDDSPKQIDKISGITKAFLFPAPHNVEVRDKYNLIESLESFFRKLSRVKTLKELGYES